MRLLPSLESFLLEHTRAFRIVVLLGLAGLIWLLLCVRAHAQPRIVNDARPVYVPLALYYSEGEFDHAAILTAATGDVQECLRSLQDAIDAIVKLKPPGKGQAVLGDCVAVPYAPPTQ
jgi:hypothetical protein